MKLVAGSPATTLGLEQGPGSTWEAGYQEINQSELRKGFQEKA